MRRRADLRMPGAGDSRRRGHRPRRGLRAGLERPACYFYRRNRETRMNRLFSTGGLVASIVLIAFGIGCIAVGLNGRGEVRDTLKQEHIVGTPDMAKSIANKPIETGGDAKEFANGIRKHTLEATDDRTYAEMG